MHLSDDDLETCLRVLQHIADDPAMMSGHARFKTLVAKIHKTGKKEKRAGAARERQAASRAVKAATVLVRQRQEATAVPALPAPADETAGTLCAPQRCYVCKQAYTEVHWFYHQLCPTCAKLNYHKRLQRADLLGRVALITGGRIKIGHQTALRLLRDGARVIVTTRFPHDAAQRFAQADDFADWRERLTIYPLDLRNVPAVEAFAQMLIASGTALDILINNAAQTIQRPLAFYQQLIATEQQAAESLPQALRPLLPAPALAEAGDAALQAYFPLGRFDQDGQPLDLRPSNSWVLRLHEVSTLELLEVQLVNAIAPFLLTSRLKPLLLRSPASRRFIVNVSAMEGQFARASKTVFHPHTNMAKAALNMLTRTSAADYAQDGIYMNSVDTGWITDENPHPRRLHAEEVRGFFTPLDVIDGMARLYDPVVTGLASDATPVFGQFLKDYCPHPW